MERLFVVAVSILIVSNQALLPEMRLAAPAQAAPQSPAAESAKLVVPKVFHIAGIREVPRNTRGDLMLTAGELTFQQGKKERLLLPFARIQHVQFFAGERNYEKAAYGAAVATLPIGGIGALLILKKHKVATFVFDYVNERGGRMGLVIQMEVKDGSACKEWMARFGVAIEEPAPAGAAKTPKQ